MVELFDPDTVFQMIAEASVKFSINMGAIVAIVTLLEGVRIAMIQDAIVEEMKRIIFDSRQSSPTSQKSSPTVH